jgi:hypothetical protein
MLRVRVPRLATVSGGPGSVIAGAGAAAGSAAALAQGRSTAAASGTAAGAAAVAGVGSVGGSVAAGAGAAAGGATASAGGASRVAASGTAAWVVEDATGEAVGTANYTVNYEAGNVRFMADTDGTAYYLSGRSFEVNKAAASVWEKKAAHVVDAYDFAADGASFKRSQMHDHCLRMAAQFRNLAVGMKVGRLFRSDAA